MDRNFDTVQIVVVIVKSLSARRAWIEMLGPRLSDMSAAVALRKESVDRNNIRKIIVSIGPVALRKESVDRNVLWMVLYRPLKSRSPQGERG